MKFVWAVLLLLILGGIGGGAYWYFVMKDEVAVPQQLEKAVRLLTHDLRMQLIRHHKGLIASFKETRDHSTEAGVQADAPSIVIVPFVDANFGEVVKVTQDIEHLVAGWLVDSGSFRVSGLTPESLIDADYVLFGVLLLDDYRKRSSASSEKRYHLIVSAVEHKTRTIVAEADSWIAESDLDYTPTPLYRGSPMFPRDKRLASMVAIARSAPGKQADREYYDSLETNALMAEAESYFDIGEYAHARTLFKRVTARKDGKVMRAFLGLYRTDVELHDMIAAEIAFHDLVAIGASTGLNTKFLFQVNSTEFVANASLRAQYEMWTRQIGQYFSKDGRCIDIIGHSSKTGTDEHNQSLSVARAQLIRDKIVEGAPAVAKKALPVGKGATENIVGSGTDDERDALDRRVEVVVVDCGKGL